MRNRYVPIFINGGGGSGPTPQGKLEIEINENGVTTENVAQYAEVEITTDVQPTLENVNVQPTKEQQTITPSEDFDGIGEVVVDAVQSDIDENIKAENIKKDVEILGVVGTLESGGETPESHLIFTNTSTSTRTIGISFNNGYLVDAKYSYDGETWTDVPSDEHGLSTVNTKQTYQLTTTNNVFHLKFKKIFPKTPSTYTLLDCYNTNNDIIISGDLYYGCTHLLGSGVFDNLNVHLNSSYNYYNVFSETTQMNGTINFVGDSVGFHEMDNACYKLGGGTFIPLTLNINADCIETCGCYQLFRNLTRDFDFSLVINVDSVYNRGLYELFSTSKLLTKNPLTLNANFIDTSGCYRMFYTCVELIEQPYLPTPKLGEAAYSNMFYGCTKLSTAHDLPCLAPATGAYNSMYYNCSSLVTAPQILATDMSSSDICSNMFNGCTALTVAPQLHSMVVGRAAYSNMFNNCTSLRLPPELPATSVKTTAYNRMFYGCTALEESPELPCVHPTTSSYEGMFYNCRNLKKAKPIHFTNGFDTTTTRDMFNGCTALEEIEFTATTPPPINTTMFLNTNNTFIIYVPDESVSAYQSANNWSQFAARIKGISEKPTE